MYSKAELFHQLFKNGSYICQVEKENLEIEIEKLKEEVKTS